MLRAGIFKAAGVDLKADLDKIIREDKPTVYLAGAMFNEGEQYVNALMATALEEAGFKTFLPQRDGFEFGKLKSGVIELGFTDEQASEILSRIIFAFDVYQVIHTDVTVYNNEGRTPDEGAVSECGISWAVGKLPVFYSTDMRSLIGGANNPLTTGLSGFEDAKKREQAVQQAKENYLLLKKQGLQTIEERIAQLPPIPRQTYELGVQIMALKMADEDNITVARKAVEILCPEWLDELEAGSSIRPGNSQP